MQFQTIKGLTNFINDNIGDDFINKFQYGRKAIKGASKVPNKVLFSNNHVDERWAINGGGGTEIQYHISYNNEFIYYGLGFSAQYVQFNNEMSPVDYIKPFIRSFLIQQNEIKEILPDYTFVIGTDKELRKVSYGNFILYGKTLPITKTGEEFELSDDDSNTLLLDLKRQWSAYELIFKGRYSFSKTTDLTDRYLELLHVKPQLILQGAPGTGKTYAAQAIAYQLITGKAISELKDERKQQLNELEESGQYAFVQFHPAYSYEDFIRGISATPVGNTVTYKAENRLFSNFAEKASQNLNDSKKAPAEYTREEWAKQKIDEFRAQISEQIAEQGKVALNEIVFIDRINSDTIRYRGGTWQIDGGVPNRDLLQMYLNKVQSLDDVKNLSSLSLSAKNNSSYWLKMLEKFRQFLSNANAVEPSVQMTVVQAKSFVFVIDEINRANLPAVLGELIYALEYRDIPVNSLYALEDKGNTILIPSNLFVIGTMNTADRSVGHLDYAIRRRFSFIDVPADESVILHSKAKILYQAVKALFVDENEERKFLSHEFDLKDILPGHSYYMAQNERELEIKLTYEILPILKEYVRDGILTELPENNIQELYDTLI